jgi:hypothetical protein
MNKTLTWTIILVIILIVISFFFYYSFTGTKIQGLVINSIEQKPISGVSIRINDKYYYTDDEGRFTAYKPIFKPVELIIEKSGFKTVIKKINTKGFSSVNNLEILLEPLTFSNILDYTSKDLTSYLSYNFRYTWKTAIDEKYEKTTYMLYSLNKDGVLRFKYTEDDRFGNTIIEREIIHAIDTIFYRDNQNPNWIKTREEEVSIVKLQEPLDIIQIFRDPNEPASFVAGSTPITLYESINGSLYTEYELAERNISKDNKELIAIQTKPFTAKWNILGGKKEITFYLDSNTYTLIRADLYEESPDESGKIKKQNLSFTITNINKDIKIELPEV